MSEVSLNYKNKLEINITPLESTPTWARIHKGFSNLSQSMNEVLHQASYLGDAGWGSTEVTGGQFITTLTGVRYYGDLAQDFMFSDDVMMDFGEARKTQLRITRQNESIIEWDVTLANITEGGGDSQQPSSITVAVHGNGAPTILSGALLEQLTVVSVAGSLSGDTAIYVNPAKEAGNSYKYKVGTSVEFPSYNEDLTLWDAWDGSAEITAATGKEIVIAEVDSSNLALKAGKATVTAMA